MIKFIIKKFINNYENTDNNDVRESYGVLSGTLGIICNTILFIIKLISGFLIGSIGVISDAFNNLSDTGSSVVTIIGTKLSNKKADKEHPFGHGRIEYISSLVVGIIIILVGFELFKTSVSRIIKPVPVSLNIPVIIILISTLFIKLWMFSYNRYIGRKINSGVVLATSEDSKNDIIATFSVIIASVADKFLSFSIDGIAGTIVSLFILYSGYSIAKDTVDILLGKLPDQKLVDRISSIILENEAISGIHDLMVHDYGPGRIMASVHAEVPENSDIIKIHDIIDRTENIIEEETGVHIVIHMDPIVTSCEKTNTIKDFVCLCALEIDSSLSIHDFRMSEGEEKTNLIFDLCVPVKYSGEKKKEILRVLNKKIKEKNEKYNTVIRIDDSY